MTLNETAYAEFGVPYVGAQQLWNMFFDYASYTSVMAWMAFFGYSHIKATLSKFMERWRSRGKTSVYDQYTDPLNVLMRSYEEVPLWWYIALFLVSFLIIITLLACGYLYIPLWTYFIALLTGAVVVIVCSPSPPLPKVHSSLTDISSHWDGSTASPTSNSRLGQPMSYSTA
jgi:OPT oligopeptide transporter protein